MPELELTERQQTALIIKQYIEQNGVDETALEDMLGLCYQAEEAGEVDVDFEHRDWWMGMCKYIRTKAMYKNIETSETVYGQYYEKFLLFESEYLFLSFILYMEKNRPYEKRFYEPRRMTLHVVVQDLQDLEDGKFNFYGLSEPPRTGKALAYDTPILTRGGWKKHGELCVGDEVIGMDGKFKRVLAVHPPCEMQYRVKFADGEEIICHGNHEWLVHKRRHNDISVVNTTEIASHTRDADGHRVYTIPFKQIVCGEHKELAVDPYTLGVWLGDGRNGDPDICEPECDYAIVQKIIDNGHSISWHTVHKDTGVHYYGIRGLRSELQKYGMCHSRKTTTKHIPDEYLTASVEQRLWLLAGLLDTDGCLTRKEHRYSFSTTEPELRDGFVALVNSFGWRTCVTEYDETKRIRSDGWNIWGKKKYWRISFNPTMHIPCQVERKQLFEFSELKRRVAIESVEPISGIYGNCITVEGGVYLAGNTLKPTHNSTVCIFFMSWIMCKRPDSHNAMGGHSGILAKGFHKELLNLVTSEEYCFAELYERMNPGLTMLRDKSADEFTITLGHSDRFATTTCRGIDGTWTGAVDISFDGYLYVDDLIRDREHSLSPTRMENTFQEMLNEMFDRLNDGARVLMVGTLWSVLDPLERMRVQYGDRPDYFFRRIPALDPITDESNFAYEYNGFSTQYYREMRERLDKPEWMAKYQQMPFVREGLLFPADELRYFNGILPEGDSRIVAVVDVAFGGGDSLSMPIGREYENGDVYIFDWVFSKGAKEITIPRVVGKIIANEIRVMRFEGNAGGDMYCQYVDDELSNQGWKCSCTAKRAPNNMDKMAKINAYAGDIKRNFIFLDEHRRTSEEKAEDKRLGITRYERSAEYEDAMQETCMFVTVGKNTHDDAVDSLTQLAMFVENPYTTKTTITRGGRW